MEQVLYGHQNTGSKQNKDEDEDEEGKWLLFKKNNNKLKK
jgi:hypothetical protein